MPATTFTVDFERVQKTAAMFGVPFDLESAFGPARPPLKATVRGHTTPGVYDGDGLVVVNRVVKAATGVDGGDRARVRYVERGEDVKRPETGACRIAAAVERVRGGEPRR